MMRKGAMRVTSADFTLAVALAAVVGAHSLDDLIDQGGSPDASADDPEPTPSSPALTPEPNPSGTGTAAPGLRSGSRPVMDFGDATDNDDIPF
jgi:hypothetical protein